MSELKDKGGDGYRALSAEVKQQLAAKQAGESGVKGVVSKAVDSLVAAGDWTRDELSAAADYLRRDLGEAAELLAREGDEWRQSPTWLSLEQGFWSWLLEVTDRTACEWHEVANELRHGGNYRCGDVVGLGTLQCQRCGHGTTYDHPQTVAACPHCGGELFSRLPLDP